MAKTLIQQAFLVIPLIVMTPFACHAAPEIRAGSVHDFSEFAHGQSSQEAFEDLIKNHNVVIDFYAVWCGPCKAMTPILNAVAQDFKHVVFVKVNVDNYDEISNRYHIKGIPAFLFFKQGNLTPVQRSTGTTSKAKMASMLASLYPR